MSLVTENTPDRPASRGRRLGPRVGRSAAGAPPGTRRGMLRRTELHAGSPRLVEADGDRLLGRRGAVLPFTNVVHLLAHELAGLRARRLTLPLVAARSLQSFL